VLGEQVPVLGCDSRFLHKCDLLLATWQPGIRVTELCYFRRKPLRTCANLCEPVARSVANLRKPVANPCELGASLSRRRTCPNLPESVANASRMRRKLSRIRRESARTESRTFANPSGICEYLRKITANSTRRCGVTSPVWMSRNVNYSARSYLVVPFPSALKALHVSCTRPEARVSESQLEVYAAVL
jgi:hypothetical protein